MFVSVLGAAALGARCGPNVIASCGGECSLEVATEGSATHPRSLRGRRSPNGSASREIPLGAHRNSGRIPECRSCSLTSISRACHRKDDSTTNCEMAKKLSPQKHGFQTCGCATFRKKLRICERGTQQTLGWVFPQRQHDNVHDAPLHTNKHGTSWRFDLVSPWRLDHPSGSRQDTYGTLGPLRSTSRARARDTGHRHTSCEHGWRPHEHGSGVKVRGTEAW